METAALEKLVHIKKKKNKPTRVPAATSVTGEVHPDLPSHTFLAAKIKYGELNCVEILYICTGNYF